MPTKPPPSRTSLEARRLRALRLQMGLSQRELASHFKVTHGAVANWEAGSRPIPGPVLRLIEIYEAELDGRAGSSGAVALDASRGARALSMSATAWAVIKMLVSGGLHGCLTNGERATQIRSDTQEAIGLALADRLGVSKALLMKLGQMASYLPDLLPEAVRLPLVSLRDGAKPMAPDVIARVIQEDLGRPPHELFEHWCPFPFAAASIGQVHRATLRGGLPVAVKVQYPRVVDAIRADLDNLDALGVILRALFRNWNVDAFLAECRARILEECDYRREADNLELFGSLLSDRADVVVPALIREHCGDRVLTTVLHEGETLEEFTSHASQAERDRVGLAVFRATYEPLFRYGVVNADPHPSNFLFTGNHVVLLDFGSVKRFDPAYLELWKALMRALLRRDDAEVLATGIAMGFAPRPDRIDETAFIAMFNDLATGLTADRVTKLGGRIDFGGGNLFALSAPAEFAMGFRATAGVAALVAALGAEANWRRILAPLVEGTAEVPPGSGLGVGDVG